EGAVGGREGGGRAGVGRAVDVGVQVDGDAGHAGLARVQGAVGVLVEERLAPDRADGQRGGGPLLEAAGVGVVDAELRVEVDVLAAVGAQGADGDEGDHVPGAAAAGEVGVQLDVVAVVGGVEVVRRRVGPAGVVLERVRGRVVAVQQRRVPGGGVGHVQAEVVQREQVVRGGVGLVDVQRERVVGQPAGGHHQGHR